MEISSHIHPLTQPQEGPSPHTSHDSQSQAPQSIRQAGTPLSHPRSSSWQNKRPTSIQANFSFKKDDFQHQEELVPKGTPTRKTVDLASTSLALAEPSPTSERHGSPPQYPPNYSPSDVRPSRPEDRNRPPSKLPSPVYSESWKRNESASSRHLLPTPPDTPCGVTPKSPFHRVASPPNQIPTPPPTPQIFVPPSISPTIPSTPRPLHPSLHLNPSQNPRPPEHPEPSFEAITPHVTSVSSPAGPVFDSARTERRLSPVIEDVGHQAQQQDHLPEESLARRRRPAPPFCSRLPLSVSSKHSPPCTVTNNRIPDRSFPAPEKLQNNSEPARTKHVQVCFVLLARSI
jgi:hypothetical protein